MPSSIDGTFVIKLLDSSNLIVTIMQFEERTSGGSDRLLLHSMEEWGLLGVKSAIVTVV